MLEAMVPPSAAGASQGGGGGGATAKEATPIPLKALNLIAMHPKIRLMEMVKVGLCCISAYQCGYRKKKYVIYATGAW